MIVEYARVIAYADGIATVQCYAQTSCGGCRANQGCGTKSLSALAGEKQAPCFEIRVSQVLKVGDLVKLGLSENTLLLSVFWLYFLPLTVLLASALGFSFLFDNELWVAVGILVSTLTCYAVVARFLRFRVQAHCYRPVFLGKV